MIRNLLKPSTDNQYAENCEMICKALSEAQKKFTSSFCVTEHIEINKALEQNHLAIGREKSGVCLEGDFFNKKDGARILYDFVQSNGLFTNSGNITAKDYIRGLVQTFNANKSKGKKLTLICKQ